MRKVTKLDILDSRDINYVGDGLGIALGLLAIAEAIEAAAEILSDRYVVVDQPQSGLDEDEDNPLGD